MQGPTELVLTQIQARVEEVAAELGAQAWLEIWAAMAALDYPQPLQVQSIGMRVEAVVEPCMEMHLAVEVREAGATERMAQTIQAPQGKPILAVAAVAARAVVRGARAEPADRA
jgi:hypothetical protein